MAPTAFPNYTQIPSRLSVPAWWAIRVGSLVAAIVVAGLLIASPDDGLFVMWQLVIPLLPALFLIAPGLWRNMPAGTGLPIVLSLSVDAAAVPGSMTHPCRLPGGRSDG